MFSPSKKDVDLLIAALKGTFVLTDEGDVSAYLGIQIEKYRDEKENETLMMSQPHLIQRILDTINLMDQHLHDTPAEPKKLLTKDTEGERRKCEWSYHSILGMLNYLCTTRPKILFAVHQCAQFSIDPRLSHEIAVKRIARYLKRMMMEGLILRPDFALSTQCFVDADFAGAWDKEDCTDPSSVYSHTGYVIMYTRCPILWVSRLQTEVELSTMEAEYIALSQAMRDLIPFMNLVNDVSQILNIKYNSPEVQYKST